MRGEERDDILKGKQQWKVNLASRGQFQVLRLGHSVRKYFNWDKVKHLGVKIHDRNKWNFSKHVEISINQGNKKISDTTDETHS